MEDAGDSTDPKRERNRILARETRMRKKNMLTSLKDQVSQLVKDNERLKTIIQTKLDKKLASKILMECCGSLPDVVATMSNKATALLTREDYGLIAAIRAAQRAFCITDPHLADNPIVFASQGFLELTGYTSDQVISRNCRFLQGPGTDLRSVEILADGIRKGIDTSVPLLNYKADGTPFWNQIYVAALRDSNNVIVNYVGVQCEIPEPSRDANGNIILGEPQKTSAHSSEGIGDDEEDGNFASYSGFESGPGNDEEAEYEGRRVKKIKVEHIDESTSKR